jgi:hypothetical protein
MRGMRFLLRLMSLLAFSTSIFAADSLVTRLTWLPHDSVQVRAQADSTLTAVQSRGYLGAHRMPTSGEVIDGKNAPGEIVAGDIFTFDTVDVVLEPQSETSNPVLVAVLREAVAPYLSLAASQAHMEAMRASIVSVLRREGYAFAAFTLLPAPAATNQPAHRLHLTLRVWPGSGYKFGGWVARGTRTRPEVLSRLSLLEFGESFDDARIGKGMSRLRRLGYYASVDSVALVRDTERNLLYPVLQVTDDLANRVGGLLGYDSEAEGSASSLSGFVDVHLVNVRGTARDVDFKFESRPREDGKTDREASLIYVEPWLPGLPVGLRLSGSIWLQDSLYDQIDAAAALLLDLDMSARLEITLSRQWSHDFLLMTESEAYAGGMGLKLDHRDRAPFTLSGYRIEVRTQGIRRELSGAGDSSRYLLQGFLRGESFLPLGRRWLLRSLVEAGGDWPRDPLPVRGDRFDIGGAQSLRGYREREFSTALYGFAQGELQYLLAGRGRALLFAAPGLIDRIDPVERTVWWRRVLGYGAGLALGSEAWSVGLLYALNPERRFDDGLLHVTVENRF